MRKLYGKIHEGNCDFTRRMDAHPSQFHAITGKKLYPGTLNVDLGKGHEIQIQPDFVLQGSAINEPEQDLLFEVCLVNGRRAYWVRPYNHEERRGGHDDRIIEIISTEHLRSSCGFDENRIEITLFRE